MRPGTSISGRERARGSRSTHQISAPSPLNMPALRRTPVFHRRVWLAAFVVLSLIVPLAPAGASATLTPATIGQARSGDRWVEVAALGDTGAMLLATGGSDGLAFFELPAE